MKCKNCGGTLLLKGNHYSCENCGSESSIIDYFESTEVMICYIETDDNGKRTNDHLFAQEIYQHFQNLDVNLFFERISVKDLSYDDYVSACDSALNAAKILIFFGTDKHTFEKLLSKYKSKMQNKKILSVFSNITANALPSELASFQALDYQRVGGLDDLVNSVYNLLGRSKPIEVKSKKKRNIRFWLCVGVATLFAVAILSLTTMFVLDNSNSNNSSSSDLSSSSEMSYYEIYQKAIEFEQQESYASALEWFLRIPDYSDAKKHILSLLYKYEGYYEKDGLSFHFETSTDLLASVKITLRENDKVSHITATVKIDNTEKTFSFSDSYSKNGTITMKLNDTSIDLNVTFTDNYFSSKQVSLLLAERSSSPLSKNITAEELANWVENKVSDDFIISKGYELEFYSFDGFHSVYRIKDQNIALEFIEHELINGVIFDVTDKSAHIFTYKGKDVPYAEKTFEQYEDFVCDLFGETNHIEITVKSYTIYQNYGYKILDDNTAEIKAYLGSEKNVVVPSKIEGYTVTSIGKNAFYDCSSLQSVTIPNGVTSIGSSAFYYCKSLQSVTIPNSVTSIGASAFYWCESLQSITIPGSVTSIGEAAFRVCGLTSITIPEGVTSIGDYAFGSCSSLKSITIPNSVTSIGDYVFDASRSLENITVAKGNSVYHSDGNCLIETATKTLITGCKTSVIPSNGSVTSIGDHAFDNYDSLESIIIPNGVTSIGNSAFFSCESLKSITVSNSVTSIGDSAFIYCRSLKSITIPNSVTSIGEDAFGYCDTLKEINFTGAKAQWNDLVKNKDLGLDSGVTIHCTDGDITFTY